MNLPTRTRRENLQVIPSFVTLESLGSCASVGRLGGLRFV
jgi:hypothetical protein